MLVATRLCRQIVMGSVHILLLPFEDGLLSGRYTGWPLQAEYLCVTHPTNVLTRHAYQSAGVLELEHVHGQDVLGGVQSSSAQHLRFLLDY